MFGFLKRTSKHSLAADTADAGSSELTITADGQLSVMGMDVQLSEAILGDQIQAHVQRLQSLHDQQATQAQPSLPDDNSGEALERLQRSIHDAKSDLARKAYVRSFLNIAEAYDALAIITNQPDKNGSTAWDLGWNVLDKEALKAVIAISRSKQDLLATDYVELLFARGMHYLREMRYAPDKKASSRSATAAITMFYTYLLVVYKLGLNHWELHDALRNIHIAVQYGAVSEDQLQTLASKIAARSTVQASEAAMEQAFKAVQGFRLSEEDQQNLPTLIY